jgi:type II secretory pathway component PulF
MALKDILGSTGGFGSLLSRKETSVVSFNNQRTFEYVAASASGARHKGKMQANSASAVSAALQADGWMPLSVSEASNIGVNMDLTALFGRGEKAVKLSVGEAATFFRQTAELLRAGVAMTFILQALGEEAPPKIRKICDGLAEGLNAGVPLSEAMLAFPDAFDKVTRAYIASGEASGTLPETMARLAVSMEKKNDLRLKIKSVTAYPKMVGIAIGGIVFAILKFMVPLYEDIYASFQSGLPTPTRVLVAISKNLTPIGLKSTFPYPFFIADDIKWGPLGLVGRVFFLLFFIVGMESWRNRRGKDSKLTRNVLKWGFVSFVTVFAGNYRFIPLSAAVWGVAIGLFMGVRLFVASGEKNAKRARLIDKIRFRLPVFGGITRLNAIFQWSTTLGGALASGVALTRALVLAGETSGSRWHASLAEPLQAAVMGGRPLSEALADYSDLYPATLRAMVTTGEVTGDLPTMFANISHSAEVEVDAMVAGLSAKVEVMLLVVMGVVVGGLLVSLYLPIINLATAAGGGG